MVHTRSRPPSCRPPLFPLIPSPPSVVCIQTVSVDFVAKQVPIANSGTTVELYLFDCAGQSIFNQRNLNSKHVRAHTYVSKAPILSSTREGSSRIC